jgi:hypothetical protein
VELVGASNGSFELLYENDPGESGHDLTVVVSIDCRGFEH